MISVDSFRKAFGQLAGAVTLVTTAIGDDRRGLTATAVCSVCAEPPTVLACVNDNTGTYKMIEESRVFGLNILDLRHQSLAELFAGRSGLQGDERFKDGPWVMGAKIPIPVLKYGATTLECSVKEIVHVGTHGIVIGAIEEVRIGEISPLLYHAGGFRSIAREFAKIAS